MSVCIVLAYIFLVVTGSLCCVGLCLYCGGIGGDDSRCGMAMEAVHYGIVDIPLVGVYCTK